MNLTLPLNPVRPWFVRVHGRAGVHELRAVIDTASTLSLIRRMDAIELGYSAYYNPHVANFGQGTRVLTPHYMVELPTVILSKVEVGKLVSENLLAVCQDMTEDLGVDVVLGQNFLKDFRACFDFAGGEVALTQKERGRSQRA